MGLDIALGIMVLFGAIRGWFRGFVTQAIHLGGIVGSIYTAGPLRDYVRPYVAKHLTSIPPSMFDRMLWWGSAVVSYLAMVGLANLAVKLYRRRPYGEPEPSNADQFAGMLLAGGKALVVAAFLVGAIDKHAMIWIKHVSWADEQAQASTVLKWNAKYQPSERIWSAAPVQHFVTQVQKMGIASPTDPAASPATPETVPVQTASRPPRLDLPVQDSLDPRAPDFLDKLDAEVKRLDQRNPRP